MFIQRRNRSIFQAAATILGLIHDQTVYNLRNTHKNAAIALFYAVLQSVVLLVGIMAFFMLMGSRTAPIRGDTMLFFMSGIFIFMSHVKTVMTVSGSGGVGGMVIHGPLSPAIMVCAAALSTLYIQTLAAAAILGLYHVVVTPIYIDNVPGTLAMFLMGWISGICAGLVFLSMKPWSPRSIAIMSTIYSRVNMIASGKMFVANMIPNFLLPLFIWNPLFHIVDQARGFIFLNYTPQKTSLTYPIWVSFALLVVGLLIKFTTDKYESVSWKAAE